MLESRGGLRIRKVLLGVAGLEVAEIPRAGRETRRTIGRPEIRNISEPRDRGYRE